MTREEAHNVLVFENELRKTLCKIEERIFEKRPSIDDVLDAAIYRRALEKITFMLDEFYDKEAELVLFPEDTKGQPE